MSAITLDGRELGRTIEKDLRSKIDDLKAKGVSPHLAVVIVGDDPASHVYVRNKEIACNRCGIISTRIDLDSTVTEQDILRVVEKLNSDESVHGILVQSPLPPSIDESLIIDAISPLKDVDGFHKMNLGNLVQGDVSGLLPCTPAGIMKMLELSGYETSGKNALVIGRSRIVGMPISILLAQKGIDSTVTVAHSRTKNLADICLQADLIIAAIGRAEFVKSEWVKPGAMVIDVGINRVPDSTKKSGFRLTGDVDPEVAKNAGWISPVPGGVGPMTIAMLMSNTVLATEILSR
ncbi:TPA: bifunctional 5,10-methylenetetrahydrofolate dehydrogenase/5,10-methenyltetrahydrofolate cyclohydrolase [Candidatus Thalassarchaeaceae archaeon]|nr:bifunctional 5,10-methylenetetrahydrofolate dehydrogenase/5,10-methenyltetrahydrofolate cyclohydrolase [Euryarchaeota archaeon]MDC3326261.1 bifunctional 5,10-methylenetetrahydrofolate dehydrogenase/5,10-methenyltetrahydrofolate cyclohydrolase [Euryarchaeota archaeon]DAC67725.1 MAG TPA: bifunctional 5,10-methylenetetrahydrofolate dehydrogenase/5,10-methenyltetrahydrofolate cyclohydrolase [Candidatus Poseidoniales archaeon]HII41835.1 bifunctional 5,10-methylenetetrahydrofolate dehydrogenase/5,1